jgi:hypothetical protein
MFKKRLLIILLLFLFPLSISAQTNSPITITIMVNPEIGINENLEFFYVLKSETPQKVKFIPQIKCPNTPQPMLEIKEILLEPGKEYKDKYFSMKVNDFIEPQKCVASIHVLEPFEQVKEKKFNIVTNPNMDITILFCKDKKCAKKSRVYKIGETLFLNYKTKIEAITEAKANITAPDNSTQSVDLPAEIMLKQAGIYKITVSFKADNYKDNIQNFEITVLKEGVKINDKRICHPDGQCVAPENKQNCPQDCLRPQTKKQGQKQNYFWSIVSIIVIIFMGAIYFLVKRQQNGNY